MATSSQDHDGAAASYITFQKPCPELKLGSMRASLSSYPPLGQATQLSCGDVKFHAVLEVDQGRVNEPWQVALWYSQGSDTWEEIILSRSPVDSSPSSLATVDETLSRLFFSSTLSVKSTFSFTLKFRPSPESSWRWARDEQGLGDGTVIVNSSAAGSDPKGDLKDLIKHLNPCFSVQSAPSQVPRTQVWTLDTTAKAANGEDSYSDDIDIGVPWGNFVRYDTTALTSGYLAIPSYG